MGTSVRRDAPDLAVPGGPSSSRCSPQKAARRSSRTSVSRRHARVFSDEDGSFYIEDCGSTHGTFVAGSRITSTPVRLFDGLRVSFGTAPFELVPSNMMAGVMAAMKAMKAANTKQTVTPMGMKASKAMKTPRVRVERSEEVTGSP